MEMMSMVGSLSMVKTKTLMVLTLTTEKERLSWEEMSTTKREIEDTSEAVMETDSKVTMVITKEVFRTISVEEEEEDIERATDTLTMVVKEEDYCLLLRNTDITTIFMICQNWMILISTIIIIIETVTSWTRNCVSVRINWEALNKRLTNWSLCWRDIRLECKNWRVLITTWKRKMKIFAKR